MLHTSRFLMDEMSGQFYAVYGNTYQCMSTKPMLEQTWGTGELIDQLAVTRQAFGYAGLSGPMPLLNQSQPAACSTCNQQDDTLSKKPAPKTIQYQPPSFNLDRPTMHLTMEERIQVHHNYISAVSNLEHKKDLINRLKRSDPHNIPAYEAEMTHHMILHDDVLGRILTFLKQDGYYRTLEELPVIDSLTTYEDIQLFPKLYDTTTIIERVTSEADLIKRQIRQPGMYPPPKTPLPSTSGFVPKPSPALPAHHLNIHHHSRLCLHNLLHHNRTIQITYTHTHNLKTHHYHPPLHNLGNSLLLGQILIHPPSLSFQLQRHISPCPAHHYNTFLSL